MNSENIKNNDPLQLKQMIIFLKAELTKYEHKVKQYKDSYHYSVIENLEQENAQLTKEKNELTKKLNEAQRNRRFISVDTAWKTKTDWLPVNKQLNDVMKKLKDDAGTNHKRYRKQERQITSLHKKFIEQKSGLEQFEYRFVDLFQKATDQVHTQIKNANITNEERLRFEDERRRLVKKIEEKNNEIEELQREIIDLKEQQKMSEDSIVTTVLKNESAKTSELLLQLEHQMKEGLAKSLDSEGKWEAKLAVFEDMKQRFLKEMEEKDNKIENLQLEMADMKKHKKMSEDNIVVAVLKSESVKTSELLLQLEHQMKEGLAKSLDSEGKWEAKLAVFEDMKQRFLKEMEEKDNKIENLQLEMADMKKHKKMSEDNIVVAVLKSESVKTSEQLLQLEHQMKEGIAKSLDSEEEWKAKLAVFDEMKQRFLKEIDEKSNKIEELQLEIIDMKKQKELSEKNVIAAVLKTELAGTSEALLQLERQMKEGLAKSIDLEEKWEAKLAVLDDVKQRYLQEIDEKNNKIEELQLEIKDMKKQKELSEDNILVTVLKTELAGTSEALLQVERQMKEGITKSLGSEKKWEAKLAVFDDVKQRYLQEIEEKNNRIEELQLEIIDMNKQKQLSEDNIVTAVLKSELAGPSELLLQLERQMSEVLAKSVDSEEKLDAKLEVFEDVRQRLLNKVEEKNNKIEELQREIVELKEQKEMAEASTLTVESEPSNTAETLLLLERQIKEVLAKSLDYEVKLEAKLDVLNVMENKIHQLTGEIDDIKELDAADENKK